MKLLAIALAIAIVALCPACRTTAEPGPIRGQAQASDTAKAPATAADFILAPFFWILGFGNF